MRNSYIHLQTWHHLTQEQRRQHNSPIELLPLMRRQHLAGLQRCIEMSIAAGRISRYSGLQLCRHASCKGGKHVNYACKRLDKVQA